MLSLLEIAERSQKGPKMTVRDWDLGLFQKMNELVQKYEIVCPHDGSWFNLDDGLADRAFQAALDFLIQRGVYCVSTSRVVQFDEAELREAIRSAPNHVVMGEGRDQRVFRQRQPESREPLNHCPGHHAPFSEEVAPLIVKNFARIPSGDYLEGFNFTVVDGRDIHGLPMEAYATRREVAWMREGVRKAGRPGMAIALYPINTRAADLIAAMDRDMGLRPTDGLMLSTLPDVKFEQDMLAAAIVSQDYGCFGVNGGAIGLVGGFCGSLGGAIIEAIAKALAGMLIYRDYIAQVVISRVGRWAGASTLSFDPSFSWGASVAIQALNRRSNTICMFSASAGSGPGTETYLREVVIPAIRMPISGANVYHTRGGGGTRINCAATPLEAEWTKEVADATMATGLTRATASELLTRWAESLRGQAPEPGMDVRECYDLANGRPRPEYQAMYLRVKEDLAKLGLRFA